MKNKKIGDTISASGLVIFDGLNDEYGRLIYLKTSAADIDVIVISVAALLIKPFLPEDIKGRDITVNGVYEKNIPDATGGKGLYLPLIKASEVVLQSKGSGKPKKFF
jgi:hypothetical protein